MKRRILIFFMSMYVIGLILLAANFESVFHRELTLGTFVVYSLVYGVLAALIMDRMLREKAPSP
jgi:hypothetical protein